MRIEEKLDKMNQQTPDKRPGAYYVSVVDGGKFLLLAGPFETHEAALARVEQATEIARNLDPNCAFYAFGTCRLEAANGTGILNRYNLI